MPRRQNETIRVIPAASRLVQSLRDLGYDFPQAVADLVDNSLTASANRVEIDLRFDGPDSWLRITDDGCGMTGDTITEAMRYGSRGSYEDEALGRFGLGLKTASLSQCRRLSVASRARGRNRRIEIRELDLNYVLDSNRWEIFAIPPRSADKRLVAALSSGQGTVVLWQSLDRVHGYKIPSGRRAKTAVEAMSDQLRLHLGMIFHRFLAGEVPRRRRFDLQVNGQKVEPWDPFARNEPSTQMLPALDIDIETSEVIGLVRFQPYVLPSREKFSTEDAFHAHAGPRKWNAQQGLYIYRANRMIQSGGWSRMRALDEHVKLARAAIDFFPDLDAAFQINVAKVRAVIPADLRDRLKGPLEELVRAAQTSYRAHSKQVKKVNGRSRVTSKSRFRPALEAAARGAGEAKALRRIARELKELEPRLARDMGW